MDLNTCLSFSAFNATVIVDCRTQVEHQTRTAHRQLIQAVMVLSALDLAYCLGPPILGPLDEIFGRAAVWPSGDSLYPDLQPGVLVRSK